MIEPSLESNVIVFVTVGCSEPCRNLLFKKTFREFLQLHSIRNGSLLSAHYLTILSIPLSVAHASAEDCWQNSTLLMREPSRINCKVK